MSAPKRKQASKSHAGKPGAKPKQAGIANAAPGVESVIDRAERCALELYDLAVEPPARLDAPVTTAQADRFLDDLLAWATKTAAAYGSPKVYGGLLNVIAEPVGLLGCFDVHASEFTESGTLEIFNPLGQVPPEYLRPFQPTPNHKSAFGLSPLDSAVSFARNWRNADPARYWKEIESGLEAKVRDYCLASLRLVGFVNGRVKEFEEYTLPRITIFASALRTHKALAEMAGATRRRKIQDKQRDLLLELAEMEPVDIKRLNVRTKLEERIPELRGLIVTVDGSTGNAWVQLDPRMEGRIIQGTA